MALTQVNGGMLDSVAQQVGFRNRIINGAMMIDQRNAGASVNTTTATSGAYSVDRWQFVCSQDNKYTIQQNAGSVTPPAGFTKYVGLTSSSAYSVAAGDYFGVRQPIEGLNVADLGWGTANAATVTLSFWVRSSLTGTFGGSFENAAGNRSYPFSYTINSANTWEQKTIIVAGDTSGTWATDNTLGIRIMFSIGSGSTWSGTAGAWSSTRYFSATGATSVVGTNGATFYITGVQLEKGSTATSFDYRPYGTELALCRRYLPYFLLSNQNCYNGAGISGTQALIAIPFDVVARTTPTGITTSGNTDFYTGPSTGTQTTAVAFNNGSPNSCVIVATVASGLSSGQAQTFAGKTAGTSYIYFTGCEL